MGCSRSGTTLLQGLLAGHPRIHTFPETSFLINTIGIKKRPLAYLGFSTKRAHWAMERFLRRIGREDMMVSYPKRPIFIKRAIGSFISILDRLAIEAKKDIWVEKSPMHIRFIPFIEKYVSDYSIIHIIRDGREVVASMYDRSFKLPEFFYKQRNPKYNVRYWNRYIKVSRKYINKPKHYFVFYDQLIKNTRSTMKSLCEKIGIQYSPRVEIMTETAKELLEISDSAWYGKLESPKMLDSKFQKHFNEKTQDEITKSLHLETIAEMKRLYGLDI
ncbi:MAG: sulfotransferase [Deltaproteobacteria bacterium]|uniref:Sulfotransferase n=1 Tax=Candidatus Zymogenus saltonus TaxID=2844893 RepID=A0A9D8KJL0_9DELT|nr:sulfotransferase [Candidatus Zymogenus saltonus]